MSARQETAHKDPTGKSSLPHGWQWMRACDVGEVHLGRQRSPKNRSADFPTKYLRAANITERGLDLSDVLEMDFKPGERERYQLRPGDLLLAEASGSASQVGKPALWEGELPLCCFQNTLIRLRPREADSRYLLWLFTHFYRNGVFAKVAGGVGINHLSAAKFTQLLLPIAPPDEQPTIVAEIEKQFTRLDAGVAALRRVQANLERYRAAVLKAACEGRLVPTEAELARHSGRPYESGPELLAHIVAQRRQRWTATRKHVEPVAAQVGSIRSLPDGWTCATVAELVSEPLCNGISIKGSEGPVGVRALRLSAMSNSGFDYADTRYLPLSEADVDDLWIREGNFFVSRGNGSLHLVGRGTSAQQPPRPTIFPDTMIRVRLAEEVRNTRWLSTICPSHFVRTQIERKVKTTAGIYKMAHPQVEQMVIPIPPFAEQARIVAEVERRLSVVDELTAAVDSSLERVTGLRQSILQCAFEGKLVDAAATD